MENVRSIDECSMSFRTNRELRVPFLNSEAKAGEDPPLRRKRVKSKRPGFTACVSLG